MLGAVVKHRGLLRDLVVRDLMRRHAGAGLGWLWTLAQPLILIGLFYLVFARLMAARLGPGAGSGDYVIYLCAGLFPWLALQEALHRACGVYLENAVLVKKVAFPPVLLVGQVVGSSLVSLAVSLGVFFVVLALAGRPPGLGIWLVLPATLLLALLMTGGVLALSVLNVFFRDLGQAVPVFTQILFWLTPIVYAPAILPAAMQPLMAFHPLLPVLDLYRSAAGLPPPAAVAGADPSLWMAVLASVVVAATGALLFRRLVQDVADEV